MAGYQVTGSIAPDNLIGGHEVELLTAGVLMLAGQGTLKRGSVIGIVGGKGKLCDSAASDGSQTAKFVLAGDVDTTGADQMAVCYRTGKFNREALIFGVNGAPSSIDEDLRSVGIFLTEAVPY